MYIPFNYLRASVIEKFAYKATVRKRSVLLKLD